LKWRAVSFPLLLGLLAVIFLSPVKYGTPVLMFCAAVMIPLAVYECAAMLDKAGIRTIPLAAALFSLFTVISCYNTRLRHMMLWLLMVAMIFLPWLLILAKREFAVERVFNTVGVITLVSTPLIILLAVYLFRHSAESQRRLFYIICATKAMDTGGYIFGTLSGRMMPGGNHKLCPSVSPKKSWEGAVGGMLLSLAVGVGFWAWLGDMKLWKYLLLSALLAVASVLGDLTESALKRRCGVKDSGSWIPGMGGALDVLDSFIYTGLVYLLFLAASGAV